MKLLTSGVPGTQQTFPDLCEFPPRMRCVSPDSSCPCIKL